MSTIPERSRRLSVQPAPILAALLVLWGLGTATAGAAAAGPARPLLAGRSLSEALQLLQDRGWPVVFSSRLVRDTMRVDVEPSGDGRQTVLADLLRPHGLAVRDGARDRLVVVVANSGKGDPRPVTSQDRQPRQAPASATTAILSHGPAASVEEAILVTPDLDSRRGSSVVLFAGVSGDSASPPQLGDDALSAVGVLPGASSSAGSGPLSVRGGGDDDVLVMLDGLELVRPYHLGDFDSAVSFVTPAAVGHAELFTGGFPAQYGDRMSGVVDLTTRTPSGRRHFSLGLGLLDADVAVSGLVGERVSWLVTARNGSYQWPLEFSGADEHPRYWDTFGKLTFEISPRQMLLGDVLVARDSFELSAEHRAPDDSYDSGWDSAYAWIRHTAVLGRDLYVETMIGTGDVEHVREGHFSGPENPFSARDQRALESASARQDWHWEAGHLGALEWGFDYERANTRLDYRSDRDLTGPLSATGVLERFDTTNAAVYGSTQIHPTRRSSLEIGLRHDTLTLSGESHLSPRLAAAWELGPKSMLRASWGWFYQSARPYELQLEEGDADGIAGIGSERSEHQDLTFEHQLARATTIEVAAYRRRLDAPRVRFENLFDPVLMFPELAEDRVRIAPERGSAEGVELTVRRLPRRRLGWWATYSRSSVVDEVDGRQVPRSTDQPSSFRAGSSYRIGRDWNLDLLWSYHTGWPTTALDAQLVEDAGGAARWVPVLGPRNAERLPDYHRLDLRIARSWKLGPSRLEAHLDLLDLYDRENLRGFENIRLVPDDAGGFELTRQPVTWAGFVPSAGVRWSF